MGVRVLHDEENAMAAIFCSTSDFAFGPVLHAKDGRPADERAEAFIRYVNAHPESNPTSGLFGKFDIRHLSDEQLENKYHQWLAQENTQFAEEDQAAMDELRGEQLAEEREYQEARQHPERFR
jgi:hypothetical protein